MIARSFCVWLQKGGGGKLKLIFLNVTHNGKKINMFFPVTKMSETPTYVWLCSYVNKSRFSPLSLISLIYSPITNNFLCLRVWKSTARQQGKGRSGGSHKPGKVLKACKRTGCTHERHLKALLAPDCSSYSDEKTNWLGFFNSVKLQNGDVGLKTSVRQCEGERWTGQITILTDISATWWTQVLVIV